MIHNGIDRNRLEQLSSQWSREKSRSTLNCSSHEVVLLLLGTVCPRKGQLDLPKALSKLPAELHGKIRCFIVGDRPGKYSLKLEKMIKSLPQSLTHRVHVIPETPETTCFYKAADIFVCTSRFESYPRVILEAMAFELPLVATPVFGIQEQAKEGINALFYSPGNTGDLARKLETLITQGELRSRFAKNSSHVLDTLNNYEDMGQAYGEVFREAYLSQGPASC